MTQYRLPERFTGSFLDVRGDSVPKRLVWDLMVSEYKYHIDRRTNILNTTTLAEDAAADYRLYNSEYEIYEEVFDMAVELEQLIEQRKKQDQEGHNESS